MAKAPCKKCYRSIRMQKARGRAGQLSLFGEIKDYEPQCAIICIASTSWDLNLIFGSASREGECVNIDFKKMLSFIDNQNERFINLNFHKFLIIEWIEK